MWGWVAKAGAWAYAHKKEILTAVQIWKRLRAKRKANQKQDENARDYYKRVGKDVVVDAATDVTGG